MQAMEILGKIGEALPAIAAVFGILGPLAAAALFGAKYLRDRADRLLVHRVVDSSDPDLVALEELQSQHFAPEVSDETGQMGHYLDESMRGRADPANPEPYFLAFVLKHKQVPCGFLTAEYFPHSQTIFLWYLTVDREAMPLHDTFQRGSSMLLWAMAKAVDATGVPWQHIITEVQSGADETRRARTKMRHFQCAARRLSKKAGCDPIRVVRLPIDYRQPVLDTALLPQSAQHEVPEWLLYAPRNIGVEGIREVAGNYVMGRTTVALLLDTLLLKSYARAFAYSEEYGVYCRSMYHEYVNQLPDHLTLIGDARHGDERRVSAPAPRPSMPIVAQEIQSL